MTVDFKRWIVLISSPFTDSCSSMVLRASTTTCWSIAHRFSAERGCFVADTGASVTVGTSPRSSLVGVCSLSLEAVPGLRPGVFTPSVERASPFFFRGDGEALTWSSNGTTESMAGASQRGALRSGCISNSSLPRG